MAETKTKRFNDMTVGTEWKCILLFALPLMLGQTIAALDEQFLRVFGSMAGDGAVSLLNYAKRISQVPVALVGQAAAAASYPFLVSLLTKQDKQGFLDVLCQGGFPGAVFSDDADQHTVTPPDILPDTGPGP